MRFGIMTMQLEALVPQGVPPEQVMASIMSFDHAALAKDLAGKGFNPIELGGDLGMFLPHAFNEAAIEKLRGLKADGISYTVHLPLWSIEPSTPQTPVRKGSVEAVIQALRATQPLEPEVYVFHSTGALAAEFYNMNISEMARLLILQQFQNGARESLKAILSETGIPSRKLAIETIEFPLEATLELADELDLSICFDTGHVLAGFPGWMDFFEALEKCLPRIAEVHLHDSRRMPDGQRGYGEDHKPLGRGDLELERFLDRLAQANYQGPLVFELKVDEALESLAVVRAARPDYLE
jgi:sugar phosphate isomerase/epimerase